MFGTLSLSGLEDGRQLAPPDAAVGARACLIFAAFAHHTRCKSDSSKNKMSIAGEEDQNRPHTHRRRRSDTASVHVWANIAKCFRVMKATSDSLRGTHLPSINVRMYHNTLRIFTKLYLRCAEEDVHNHLLKEGIANNEEQISKRAFTVSTTLHPTLAGSTNPKLQRLTRLVGLHGSATSPPQNISDPSAHDA